MSKSYSLQPSFHFFCTIFFPEKSKILMNPTPYRPLYQFIGLFITISITFPCSTLGEQQQYANCKQPFKCGNPSILGDLKYPFWGANRKIYCGAPGHKIKCLNNTPFVEISTYNFQVVRTDPQEHKIMVAMPAFWNNLCPSVVLGKNHTNSSIIELSTISPFLVSTIRLLTILYGCPLELRHQFSWSGDYSCSINQNKTDVHFVTHTVNVSLASGCLGVATVPILQQSAQALEDNTMTLPEALNRGFELGFGVIDNSQCDTCLGSGGQCGYNNSTHNGFTCFCPDKTYPDVCPQANKRGNKKTNTRIAIGVSIGAVALLALLLGGCLVFARRRRNQLIAQQKSRGIYPNQGSSSNGGGLLIQTLGSNGVTSSQAFTSTPSTNLSQSMPSYGSSKSGIGTEKTCYFGAHVFTYAELEHATSNFHDSRELGDGGFGTVYYGVLPDRRQVAVKRLYEHSAKRVEQFMNEIRILAELHHKNLVALYGCTSKSDRVLLLVYEYVPNGTVADHIHGRLAESTFVPWLTRLSIAIQTAEALAFLHRNDVIHRDVKTANILLDNNFHVKVADFGLSRLFPLDMTHVSTAPQGTLGYVDPEYYQCYKLTEKSDVYSFGVVLIELISSKHAVDITRHRHHVNLANMALDRIQNQELHKLVDPRLGFDKDHSVQSMVKMVAELGFRCLQQDRDMRPTMDEVLTSLMAIQLEGLKAQKQQVVDMNVYGDDVGLLTNPTPPLSPELPRSNDIV